MNVLPSLIGVIHLPALAGAPGSRGLLPVEALSRAGEQAVEEAKILVRAGFQGLILENFGDTPFYKESVPPETIASMAILAAAVREVASVPIGINVLRNDARSALAIAAVSGCQFIRVNVLNGVAATDQGLIEGHAAEIMRERERLGGTIAVMADVHVKHAKSLSSDDVGLAVEETALRAGADGVILTGATTGRPIDRETLARAHQIAREHDIGIWIGSGVTSENIGWMSAFAQGAIVGSTLRRGGKAGAPLDAKRIRDFIKSIPRRKPKASRKK